MNGSELDTTRSACATEGREATETAHQTVRQRARIKAGTQRWSTGLHYAGILVFALLWFATSFCFPFGHAVHRFELYSMQW